MEIRTRTNKIQFVTLKLADGRVLRYSGPAQVWPDEIRGDKVRVRGVEISEPQDLPDGAYFEAVGGKDEDPDQRGDRGDGGERPR